MVNIEKVKNMKKTTMAASLAASVLLAGGVVAQPAGTLSAQDSDPIKMGWMQGFSPANGKTIRFTDPDYFAFPKLRWTVCHFRELMPTVGVANGSSGARELTVQADASLDAVTFTPLNSQSTMTWNEAFDANYTDGVIVMHHGRIVYERYSGCLGPNTLHGAMSVTKSLTGLLAETLVAEGKLDEKAKVSELIPELKNSAFGDATVRQVMNMTTALDYSEDYADPKAEVWVYADAGSPLPKPAGYTGPRSYFEFLQTVKKKGTHGEAFGYKTINSDALGWMIARSTGKSVADQLSERIWSRIGTQREAFYTVDSLGTPFAGGGFNATLRDMARLGQMMLDGGRVGNEQIVPPAAIARIRAGGDRATFAKAGYKLLPEWSYGGMWWVSHDDHGAYAARGVHGQTIWVDPKADMVIVRFASHPVAANAGSDPTSLPAYRAVAKHLMANDSNPLAGEAWVVEDIAGGGVIDNSQVTLQFLADGKVAGSTGCNRLIGNYELSGQQLKLQSVGNTMMACPPALMEQERKLLNMLPTIRQFQLDAQGTLTLQTESGLKVVARRAKVG